MASARLRRAGPGSSEEADMTMPAPPPDTRAAGQSGHIADHNTIADALTALDNAVGALQAAGYLPMPSGTPQRGRYR